MGFITGMGRHKDWPEFQVDSGQREKTAVILDSQNFSYHCCYY